ncbi:MAG TPA: Smr/MutS family protein [Allosphingosinicella sp.]|jgi:DNA-nicking Smr family endonuclease|nr:Smr/MutS family protein [Allosphingosinicella sp.]
MPMRRRLSADERALWRKVVETVTPLEGAVPPAAQPREAPRAAAPAPSPPAPASAPVPGQRKPGTTLDSTWDRRLSRGLVAPDFVLDLHGHNLATAYDLLDRRLDQAIAAEARLLLLITGKPPADDRRPAGRGAIRAAVGDWLAASRHAGDIAAVRNAHPRHGGAGALYIVLRRRRAPT